MIERQPQFKIGTTFTSTDKRKDVRTVTDILKTYNSAGVLVMLRYVATHQFLGQPMIDHNVVETTIARNLIKAA